MKHDKRIIFVAFFAVMISLILSLIVIGSKEYGEKPPLNSSGDSFTSVTQSGVVSDGTTTYEPLEFEGETLTVLCRYGDGLLLGDFSQGGGEVSEASYKRNKLLKKEYGFDVVFEYTESVYMTALASLSSGSTSKYDLLNINMLLDGADFLMKGSLYSVSSGIDLSKECYSEKYIEYFTMNGECRFIFGDANPSLFTAVKRFYAKEGSEIASSLEELIKGTGFSLENVLLAIREKEEKLLLDSNSLHSLLLTEPLFSLDGDSPKINMDFYLEAYSTLLSFSDVIITEGDEANVYVSNLSDAKDGYISFPLPGKTGKMIGEADVSSLSSFGVPQNISKEELAGVLRKTDLLYSESLGIYDALYGRSRDEEPLFCFYSLFGWGDFSKHAFSSLNAGKDASSLAASFSAPILAAEHALLVLYERYTD